MRIRRYLLAFSLLGFCLFPLSLWAGTHYPSLKDAADQGMDTDFYIDHIGSKELSNVFSHRLGDPNFSSGYLTDSIGTGKDSARSVVIQSGGSVVVTGPSAINSTTNRFAVARFSADGGIDSAFGTGGVSYVTFGTGDNISYSLALQSDGKFVVTGKSALGSAAGNYYFATARLNADGSLDTSFNTNGLASIGLSGGTEIARTLTLQTDGKIVSAGYMRTGGGSSFEFSIVRYNTNGTLDTTFNNAGQVNTQVLASDSSILAIAQQTDGKLMAAGDAYTGSHWNFALARYNTNGTLDTTFNASGKETTAIGATNSVAYAISLTTLGQIVASGSSYNGTNLDLAIARYNTDGSLDTSFDTGGSVTTAVGTGDDSIFGSGLTTDGKLMAAGYSNLATQGQFTVARYRTDGTLDTSFWTGGDLVTQIGTTNDVAQGVTMVDDDTIFLVGRSNNGTKFNFAISRYSSDGSLGGSGTFDPGFGT